MPDPSSSDDAGLKPFWRQLRSLLIGRPAAESLRDQIEEAIEEHKHDADSADDLTGVERTMLRNLLHFGDAQVLDVAVPRTDIIAFEAGGAFADLVALFREAGHSRVPVYRERLDDIIGMVHIKDVYARLAETYGGDAPDGTVDGIEDPVESFMRPVLFVPASMRMLDLLARMRSGRTHMAVVIDEFGGVDGLVTIEDVVEEIVGDIEDEHDEAAEGVQALGDDLYEADARIEVGELEVALSTPFIGDDIGDDVDTVGGLVFMLAGRVPAIGETIPHPSGWRFEVIDGDTRKVARVRIHPPAKEQAAE